MPDDLQPFDESSLAEFAIDGLSPMTEAADVIDLDDTTQDKYAGLDHDLSFLHTPRVRSYLDLRQIATVKDHIKRLPADGETQHGVISGRYPLFAIVPAVIELAGVPIDELWLVTLSYSRDNAADLIQMIDQGQIKKTWLLVSHYFAHANSHLYDPLAQELTQRGKRFSPCARTRRSSSSSSRMDAGTSSSHPQISDRAKTWSNSHSPATRDCTNSIAHGSKDFSPAPANRMNVNATPRKQIR